MFSSRRASVWPGLRVNSSPDARNLMGNSTHVYDQLGEFPVVGIGASAGGIAALQSLFKNIPATPNLAFVVVQHMLPDKPSRLADLMARWTPLPVCEAGDGMQLQRNKVYIAPPDRALVIERGMLSTRPLDAVGPRAGIDTIDSF